MDFTREPIIESVITPKEGCKLVVRSSKAAGQEEYFVDAVEIVSFGNTFFLRSLERPKSFLVPATDYEILEVRETRMVLKNVGLDRSIKIAGGREAGKRGGKGATAEAPTEPKVEKKRERKRHYRKRRGREEPMISEEVPQLVSQPPAGKVVLPVPEKIQGGEEQAAEPVARTSSGIRSLLPPPPTLISETIEERYKGNEIFKDVFYEPGEEETQENEPIIPSELFEEEQENSQEEPSSSQEEPSSSDEKPDLIEEV